MSNGPAHHTYPTVLSSPPQQHCFLIIRGWFLGFLRVLYLPLSHPPSRGNMTAQTQEELLAAHLEQQKIDVSSLSRFLFFMLSNVFPGAIGVRLNAIFPAIELIHLSEFFLNASESVVPFFWIYDLVF